MGDGRFDRDDRRRGCHGAGFIDLEVGGVLDHSELQPLGVGDPREVRASLNASVMPSGLSVPFSSACVAR